MQVIHFRERSEPGEEVGRRGAAGIEARLAPFGGQKGAKRGLADDGKRFCVLDVVFGKR